MLERIRKTNSMQSEGVDVSGNDQKRFKNTPSQKRLPEVLLVQSDGQLWLQHFTSRTLSPFLHSGPRALHRPPQAWRQSKENLYDLTQRSGQHFQAHQFFRVLISSIVFILHTLAFLKWHPQRHQTLWSQRRKWR